MAAGVIVGRDAELSTIAAFLDDGDLAGALVLEGEAGIGKTTLWEEAVRRSAARDVHVLSSRPGESDAQLTFVGLADLLSAAPAALEEIPAPQRRALDVALLRVDAGGPPPDQRHVSIGLLSVLKILSASRPVVVAVDDLQWFDRPSLEVLVFALRRLADEQVRLVAGMRIEREAPSENALAGALGGRLERISLGPLSLAAIHEILSIQLGHSFPRPTLVRIGRVAAGNPFYAVELGRALLAAPEPESAAAPLPVSGDVLSLIQHRVSSLPAPTRRALLMAAALSHPTMAQLGAGAIEPAEEAGLVHVDTSGCVVFDHPLFASAVYGAASTSRRRAVHREIAELVDDPEERARHLALATVGHDETIAVVLDAVAEASRARGSVGSAAELAELALRLTPPADHTATLRRTVTLARHLFHAGGDARARELLEGALAAAPAGEVRCEALIALSEIQWGDGDWERGIALCEEALAAASERSLRARAHAQLAAMGDLNIPKAAEHARAALDLLDETEDRIAYASALLSAVQWEFYAGKEPDFESVERAMALQEAAGSWEISTIPAGLARNADDFETSRARSKSYLLRAEEDDDELRRCIVLAHLATLECWMGDLRSAEVHARESLEIVEQTEQVAYRCVALHACATVDACLGRTDRARASIGEQLGLLRDSPDPVLEVMALALAGFVDLSLGDVQGADASFMRAGELLERMGWREPAPFRFQADQIEAAIMLGELDRAEALLEVVDERNRVFRRPWLSATGARCLGLLLGARGDLESAERELERALVEHERLDMPIELGRTLLELGRVRRRRRRLRAAREAFESAAATFDAVGAAVWAARARADLARTHVREAPEDLTPTELRVAELAASGLSNRLIGKRLFVSPKTVESNLSRAYRKLGIRTRAELGRVMAERERQPEM